MKGCYDIYNVVTPFMRRIRLPPFIYSIVTNFALPSRYAMRYFIILVILSKSSDAPS